MPFEQNEQIDVAVDNALLRKDVEALSAKVEKLSHDVEELVAAWNTATYLVAFIKWLASAGAAAGGVYILVKGFWEK